MRNTTALMIAASMLAAPAYAQDNVAGNTSAADAGTLANTDDASLAAEAPANGLATAPGATPIVTDNAMVDTTFGQPAADDDDDDGRFPWGLLGLLGLAGLLGRRRSDTDREDRTTR